MVLRMQRGIEPVLWGSVAEEAFGGAAEDVHYLVIAMNTKLLRNNLFILLGYAVLVQLLSLTEKNGAGMMVAMIMMVAVAIHVGVLLFGSLVLLISGKGKEAGQWLLSAAHRRHRLRDLLGRHGSGGSLFESRELPLIGGPVSLPACTGTGSP